MHHTTILDQLRFARSGAPMEHAGVRLVPLLGPQLGATSPRDPPEPAPIYRLFVESPDDVSITEVLEGGSVPDVRVDNRLEDHLLLLDGEEIHGPDVDVVQLRARVGMVFQKPNPFPKSIYENIAYVTGGTQGVFTLGINWYLNPALRVLFNWSRIVHGSSLAAGRQGLNVLAGRVDFHF